jgi:cysteine desulfurase
VLQAANSETGVLQALPAKLALVDAAQIAGKAPFEFERSGAGAAMLSAHKLGGPKGVGALILAPGVDPGALLRGGGQEMGQRAGTENVAGIAGFGAAAAASAQDLEAGLWDRVGELRNILEGGLEHAAPETIFIGRGSPRLPNTICFSTRGWKAETQVMAMDLAGFAISAGSACSSGKVRSSRVVEAMGHDVETARGAVRVSIGPTTTEAEASAFVDAWAKQYRRFQGRAMDAA